LRRDLPAFAGDRREYRPLWPSEILPELEYHETRKLIDREEQLGAAARRCSIRHGGTRWCAG
jgi:hypothetical protein